MTKQLRLRSQASSGCSHGYALGQYAVFSMRQLLAGSSCSSSSRCSSEGLKHCCLGACGWNVVLFTSLVLALASAVAKEWEAKNQRRDIIRHRENLILKT